MIISYFSKITAFVIDVNLNLKRGVLYLLRLCTGEHNINGCDYSGAIVFYRVL